MSERGAAVKRAYTVESDMLERSSGRDPRVNADPSIIVHGDESDRDLKDILDLFVDHKKKNPNQKLTQLQKRMQSGGW